MSGTTFSNTAASLFVPPKKMKAAMAATNTPIATLGILTFITANTSLNAAPMELDCTIFPMKPSARVIKIAKAAAIAFPNPPLKAALI